MNSLFAKVATMKLEGNVSEKFQWVYKIKSVIDSILWPLLIVVAAAGTIYAVVLGVNMARADSTEKREEAKKRVINVLIGMAIIIGLLLLFKLFTGPILDSFVDEDGGVKDID